MKRASLGECVGCGRTVFTGDLGFLYSDGEVACEPCASAYQEMKDEAEDDLARGTVDEELRAQSERILKACAEHVADGGSLSDKWVWEL